MKAIGPSFLTKMKPSTQVDNYSVQSHGKMNKFILAYEYIIFINLGFYSVMLHSADIFVELTVAGPFTGLHRYKFFGDRRQYLIFAPTHAVKRVISACTFRQSYISIEKLGVARLEKSRSCMTESPYHVRIQSQMHLW